MHLDHDESHLDHGKGTILYFALEYQCFGWQVALNMSCHGGPAIATLATSQSKPKASSNAVKL